MSKKELLRAAGIYNNYGLVGKGGVWIDYNPHDAMSCSSSGWHVCCRGRSLSNAWYYHGAKAFLVSGRADKIPKLQVAMTWATAEFGIGDWVKSPFGGYVSEKVLKQALLQAKEKTDE